MLKYHFTKGEKMKQQEIVEIGFQGTPTAYTSYEFIPDQLSKYVEYLPPHFNVPIVGVGASNASANGLLLSISAGKCQRGHRYGPVKRRVTAVLFLGKCGGLKEISQLGDYICP